MSDMVRECVEATMKGVRKQMKGYVQRIIREVELEVNKCRIERKLFQKALSYAKPFEDAAYLESMLEQQRQFNTHAQWILNEIHNKMVELDILKAELSAYKKDLNEPDSIA